MTDDSQERLSLAVGKSALAAEHHRLVRTALRRGEKDPEMALQSAQLHGQYPESVLAIAATAWTARMVHEHHSAAVFSRLLPQFMAAGAPLEFKTTVLRMAMDELRHASLCASVAVLCGGRGEVIADLSTAELSEHVDTTRRVASLRNALFVGLSETISIALLTEERELATEPAIHAVLDQLAADEVLHAKLGWSYFGHLWPLLNTDERTALAAYIPVALGFLEKKMLGAMPLPSGVDYPAPVRQQLTALGVMHSEDGRELMYATLESVIEPALKEHGLPFKKSSSGH